MSSTIHTKQSTLHWITSPPEKNELEEHAKNFRIHKRLNTKTGREEALEKAIQRIETYHFKSFTWFKKNLGYSDEQAREEYRHVFKTKGTCHGQSSVLLGASNENYSLEEKFIKISFENVMFTLIVDDLLLTTKFKEEAIERESEEKFRNQEATTFTLAQIKEKKQKKINEERSILLNLDPIPSKKEGEMSLSEGMHWLAKQEEGTRGVIHLPLHQITFQSGSEYFVYDIYSPTFGGLFKYPDKASFLQGMHLLVRNYLKKKQIKIEKAKVAFTVLN